MPVTGGTGGTYRVGMIVLPGNVYVISKSGVPVDGTSGTMAGKAAPGSMCIDYANGNWYKNTGTKASPVWTQVS